MIGRSIDRFTELFVLVDSATLVQNVTRSLAANLRATNDLTFANHNPHYKQSRSVAPPLPGTVENDVETASTTDGGSNAVRCLFVYC